MTVRKRRREIKVKVVWEINPDPTPYELNKWHRLWERLLESAPEKAKDGPKDSSTMSLPLREPGQTPAEITFRCTRCGQTWPAKYLPDGGWDPVWWKCPNEYYKRRKN